MLAGECDWLATARLIASDYTSPLVGVDDPTLLGLIVTDLSQPREVFAVPLPLKGAVTPAVALRSSGESIKADPSVLFNDTLSASVILAFRSASVNALLKLTRSAYHDVLSVPKQDGDRLKALCATGTLFSPRELNARDWQTACHWPEWQLKHLGFKARAIELAKLFNATLHKADEVTRASATLRQRCSRHLDLLISDRSDL
jgi:hypothetical protein